MFNLFERFGRSSRDDNGSSKFEIPCPGASKDDIKVETTNRGLSVTVKDFYGTNSYHVYSTGVRPEDVEAECTNGLLTLRIGKAADERRLIAVK